MTLKDAESANGTQTAPAAHSVDLRKTYGAGQAAVHALAGINVTFERGRFTAVMGSSGSGKSTLMHCMAGLDRPTSGRRSWATWTSGALMTPGSPSCDVTGSGSYSSPLTWSRR